MKWTVANANAVKPATWPWAHFAPAEWACKGTGRISVETAFMDRLEQLRMAFGKPLAVNSGYRSPEHNVVVSQSGKDGPHTTGRAVDIRIYGKDALDLVVLAYGAGFTGIGLQQHGAPERRYVHLDDLDGTVRQPRPWIWSY